MPEGSYPDFAFDSRAHNEWTYAIQEFTQPELGTFVGDHKVCCCDDTQTASYGFSLHAAKDQVRARAHNEDQSRKPVKKKQSR